MTYSYPKLLKKIYEEGSVQVIRGKKVKELVDVNLTVGDKHIFYSQNYRCKAKVVSYLERELEWYMSGKREIDYIAVASKFWKALVNEKNQANSNYGYVVFYKKRKNGKSAFTWCEEQLKKDKHSRQAIILYNDSDCYAENNKDFLCTQLQHFFIRDNKLTSIVYLRSSDAILGLTYDIPWWSYVQQFLRLKLLEVYPGLKNGSISVHIGSSHIYEDKFELVQNMLLGKIEASKLSLTSIVPLNKPVEWYRDHLRFTYEVA